MNTMRELRDAVQMLLCKHVSSIKLASPEAIDCLNVVVKFTTIGTKDAIRLTDCLLASATVPYHVKNLLAWAVWAPSIGNFHSADMEVLKVNSLYQAAIKELES